MPKVREAIDRDFVVGQKRVMPNPWPTVTFDDIVTITKGISYTGKGLNQPGPKLLGLGEFQPGGGAKLESVRTYGGEFKDRHVVRPGDLLVALTDVTQTGDVLGSPLLVPSSAGQECLFTHHIGHVAVRNSDADRRFLYYLLQGPLFSSFARGYATGTTVRALNPKDVAYFEFSLPSVTEQRAIAHVLGTLDDKIELNRRINETLEAMAWALFKSWFVDFEPVRAKMEGRWRPGESLPGLPADLHDLFPNRLVPSELGEIPEGWLVKSLGDCFNLTMGQSPPGRTYNEDGEGLPFFQGNANFEFRYPERRRYCTSPTRIARPDDTLVSVRAPVGSINMAWEKCCIGRGVSALRHKSGSRSFTYYSVWVLKSILAEYEQTGTVFGAINKRQFETIMVIEPTKVIVDSFEACSRAWEEHIRLNTSESRSLAAKRDVLLPKLLSGMLRLTS